MNNFKSGQTNTVHDLLLMKDELLKEKSLIDTMIGSVREELQEVTTKQEKIILEKSVVEAKIKEEEAHFEDNN